MKGEHMRNDEMESAGAGSSPSAPAPSSRRTPTPPTAPASSWTRTSAPSPSTPRSRRARSTPRGYDKIYPLEVVACWAFPKGQKAHETVVTFDVQAERDRQGRRVAGPQAGHAAERRRKDPRRAGGQHLHRGADGRRRTEARAHREGDDRPEDRQAAGQAEMALHRIDDGAAGPEQGRQGLRGRHHRAR